jgi:hypothetical protein
MNRIAVSRILATVVSACLAVATAGCRAADVNPPAPVPSTAGTGLRLSAEGIGELLIGRPIAALERNGTLQRDPEGGACESWHGVDDLRDVGVSSSGEGTINAVSVSGESEELAPEAGVITDKGIRLGDTLHAAKSVYEDALAEVPSPSYPEFPSNVVYYQDTALYFKVDGEPQRIVAMKVSTREYMDAFITSGEGPCAF